MRTYASALVSERARAAGAERYGRGLLPALVCRRWRRHITRGAAEAADHVRKPKAERSVVGRATAAWSPEMAGRLPARGGAPRKALALPAWAHRHPAAAAARRHHEPATGSPAQELDVGCHDWPRDATLRPNCRPVWRLPVYLRECERGAPLQPDFRRCGGRRPNR